MLNGERYQSEQATRILLQNASKTHDDQSGDTEGYLLLERHWWGRKHLRFYPFFCFVFCLRHRRLLRTTANISLTLSPQE